MKPEYFLRAAAIATILIAGSCSTVDPDTVVWEDGARNHPIMVEPSYRDLKVQFTGGADGMSTDDAIKFESFLADYRLHGNGSLGISVGVNMLGLAGQMLPEEPRAPLNGVLPEQMMAAVPSTIYSGSNEIQRNVIATRGLGLPRG